MVTKPSFLLCYLLSFILFFGAFSPSGETAIRKELIVAAAASLTDVLTELAENYEEIFPGIDILLNFGATGALQTQIEQGAPVDVFAGASISNLEILQKKDILSHGSLKILCRNNLVMVVRPGLQKSKIASFPFLADPAIKRIAIGDPAYVPAGKYGILLLKKLGLDVILQPKLILVSNVRQALAWVEAGEVDAAMVYGTDAKISNKIKIIAQAGPDLIDIQYGIAILKRASEEQASHQFFQFVTGPVGQKMFQKYGFLPGGDG